jgi:signal transduction histidine kinase
VESAAYFTVSELLAKVSKHASADQVWIDIRHDGGMLRIGVTDAGAALTPPAAPACTASSAAWRRSMASSP